MIKNAQNSNWEDICFLVFFSFTFVTLILGLCAYMSKGISCYHAFDWLAAISAILCLAGLGISIYTLVYLFELAGKMEIDAVYKGNLPYVVLRHRFFNKRNL